MATLKQSTAYNRMVLMVDSADHVTGKTGLTVTVTLSKNGAAFGALGGSVTEVSSGWYKVALNTTDTGTLGDLAFHCTATGADPTDFVDQVTTQILGDTLTANVTSINSVSTSSVTTVNANIGTTQPTNFTGTGASALVKSDMVDIAGAAVDATSAQLGVNVIQAAGTAWGSGAITAGAVSTAAADKIAGAAWDVATASHQTAGTTGKALTDISGGTLTLGATERNAIADAILNRDMSIGTDTGSASVRTPRQALRNLRNKWAVQNSVLSVYKEDDTTVDWTSTLATTANVNPVTSSDPAGP